MVLTVPYLSAATHERRETAARDTASRAAGIDVNVSNVTVASHVRGEDLRVTRVERDAGERDRARRRALKERRRQRALDRSRRAANPEQYHLSKRQEERALARAAAGLPPQRVVPRGPRKSRADGKPSQAYRRDQLSERYRRERAVQAAAAASAVQARRDHARRVAAEIVYKHGFRLAVEACDLRGWARRWGRSLHAFSPGALLSAIEREAAAVATHANATGGIFRASTRNTALSQHCLCGHRVAKTLAERIHSCPRCGLAGDRDAVSAALGAFVVLTDPGDPSSAIVEYEAARACSSLPSTRRTLRNTLHNAAQGRQDAPSESTAPIALGGLLSEETRRTSPSASVVARRNVGRASHTTPDETGSRRTTPDRGRRQSNMTHPGEEYSTKLRDIS
jgi:transposase